MTFFLFFSGIARLFLNFYRKCEFVCVSTCQCLCATAYWARLACFDWELEQDSGKKCERVLVLLRARVYVCVWVDRRDLLAVVSDLKFQIKFWNFSLLSSVLRYTCFGFLSHIVDALIVYFQLVSKIASFFL